MNKVLGKRLEVAEAILKELSKGSLRRSVLEKKVSKSRAVSYWCFRNVFAFLCRDGDIEKCSLEHRAGYRLTERGKQFLAWRKNS
jgi:predicted transcriptional regulator